MNIVEVFEEVGNKILTPYKQYITFDDDSMDMYIESMVVEDVSVNISTTYTNKKQGNVRYLRRADFNKCCDRYNAVIGDGGDIRSKFLDKAIRFNGEYVYYNGEIVTE